MTDGRHPEPAGRRPRPDTLAGALSESTDPMLLLRRLVGEVLVLIGHAQGSAVEVAGEDSMVYVCTAGTLLPFEDTAVALGHSLSGLAVTTGHVLKSDDTERDDRVDRLACRRVGARSIVCLPLIRAGTCVGVLKVTSGRPNAFSHDDVAILDTLAPFLATVVAAAWDISDLVNGLLTVETPGDHVDLAPHRAARQFLANVLQPGMVDEVALRGRIRTALETEPLRTVCQPVIDLTDGRMVAAEALTRFDPPEGTGRTPEQWFADAHAVGLGVELETAALRKALELLPEIPGSVSLAVNIGPAALASGEALELIEQAGSDRIVIELTEHAPVEDYPGLRQALTRLRRGGARLAIDDTGAGVSSLAHILRLEPDYIKLDRQLTVDIEADPVRRALAKALVSFASESGAQVVAEGIENGAALQTLKDLGISYGQGFHLGRPEPVGELQRRAAAYS
ncbi:MAG TPA: EAL domain-containing protein [Acidimicrobiales bacterium]|nr:EAL domain-containing protein [Acidimicrobiales bacterium]